MRSEQRPALTDYHRSLIRSVEGATANGMAAGNGRRESLTADYDGILREGALLPALSEARRRTLTALSADEPLPALVAAIESSIPLTLAVLKVANRREPDVAGVP